MPDIFVPSKKKKTKNLLLETTSYGHAHMFSAFCENPSGVSFKDQAMDEKILLFLRRHFVTNVPWILTAIILVLLPPILIFLNFSFLNLHIPNLPAPLILLSFIFYYLVIFNFIFTNFITWYFNISLVTQKRIIDIDFSDLIYKNVAQTKLSLVEDVSYTQAGVTQTFFDYGDVLIQTAAEFENFDFTAIPHPNRVTKIVEDLIGKGPNA